MDFTQWAYHPDRLPKDDTEKDKRLLELEDQFFNELKARDDVQAWLNRHYRSGDNYDSFLRSHVRHKRHLISLASYYIGQMESTPELKYREQCETCIEAIQQKKLFDRQLQWRAGNLDVPGVRLSIDFGKLEEEVLECDFLEPVTPDDIELMKEFLATDAGASWIAWGSGDSWQDYDDFFDEEGELLDSYPEWYDFCDKHRGTGYLLQLPNHRGKKEDYYEELGREVLRQREGEDESPATPAGPVDTRPFLSYWGEQRSAFYQLFEDPYFRALYEHEHQNRVEDDERNGNYEPHDDLHYLEDFTDPAPMPAAENWREALHLCRIRSLARAVTNDLDAAYAEYCFYRETGLRTTKKRGFDVEKAYKWLYEMILDGREANGEPRDFNF